MENANRGDGVDRRRLLKGGAALTGAAYVAPAVLNTAVAGASTTKCYVYGFSSGGCTADVASLPGMGSMVASALLGAASTPSTERDPCTVNPAGLSNAVIGQSAIEISVDANCEILAVAASSFPLEGVHPLLVATADPASAGYDVTTTGAYVGGIARLNGRRHIRVSSNASIVAIAFTICCTGSP